MRIGVVVDSACDLPMDYIEKHRIQILPITIHLDGQDLFDQRDEQTTLHFYREHLAPTRDAGSSPFSVAPIRAVFLSQQLITSDCVFCLTIAPSRPPIHATAPQPPFALLNGYTPTRGTAARHTRVCR